MSTIWFIRHGESESNAGLPTASAASPLLTKRGRRQASLVANHIPREPDLICISPYLRTKETAQPVIDRFPSTPVETWPVQEFTYLSSKHYMNATVSDRRSAANRYWLKSDPNYWDGPEAETFNQMIDRVEQTLNKIREKKLDYILVFSHGWFIRGLLWHLIATENEVHHNQSVLFEKLKDSKVISSLPYHFLNQPLFFRGDKSKMRNYLFFAAALRLPNASILEFELNADQQFKFVSMTTQHLPLELIGSKSLDK